MSKYDLDISIAKSGQYEGYKYFIRKTNASEKMWWWTAYVKVADKSFSSTEDVDNKIICHGGCTYFGDMVNVIPNGEVGSTVIGWDYFHYEDTLNINPIDMHSMCSLDEVEKDCKNVIDQLKGNC